MMLRTAPRFFTDSNGHGMPCPYGLTQRLARISLCARSHSRLGEGAPYLSPAAQGLRRTTRGFSLLEMIVATAILGIAIIGLMTLTTTVLANAARIREYDRAAMLARTKMNQLLVEEPLPLGRNLTGTYESGLGWEARVEPFFVPPTPQPGRTMLVRIRLTVWWDSDGRRKRLKLESFRRMIIRPEHGLG